MVCKIFWFHLSQNSETLTFLTLKTVRFQPISLWPVLNYFVQKLFLRSVLALNQQKTLSMARMILSYLQIFANSKFQHGFQPIFALKLVRIKKFLFLAKHYGHFFSRYVMEEWFFSMYYELFLYLLLILPRLDQILE